MGLKVSENVVGSRESVNGDGTGTVEVQRNGRFKLAQRNIEFRKVQLSGHRFSLTIIRRHFAIYFLRSRGNA